ncbi:MAG: hypothetical protein V3R84_03760 [Acidimicrobiia bacterium]
MTYIVSMPSADGRPDGRALPGVEEADVSARVFIVSFDRGHEVWLRRIIPGGIKASPGTPATPSAGAARSVLGLHPVGIAHSEPALPACAFAGAGVRTVTSGRLLPGLRRECRGPILYH